MEFIGFGFRFSICAGRLRWEQGVALVQLQFLWSIEKLVRSTKNQKQSQLTVNVHDTYGTGVVVPSNTQFQQDISYLHGENAIQHDNKRSAKVFNATTVF